MAREKAARTAASVSVRTEFPDRAILVRGNMKFLQEALQFVIENALQAAELRQGHGEVNIRVCYGANQTCQIFVEDNGPGMDEQTLEHALEMFFSTKPKGLGLGIGLPTAYFIVRSHGGQLRLTRNNGEGITVTITLPLLKGTVQ